MKHEESSHYIAGLLDSRGGFYLVKRKTKKYLYFKIKINNPKILDIVVTFFTKKLNIKVRDWNGVLNVTDTDSVQKLTLFMNKYCIRQDYKEILIKNSFELDKTVQ